MTASELFVRVSDLPTAEYDDELAVMDLRSGSYLAFNRTAADMWRLLDQPRSLDALTQELAELYGTTPDAIRADVAELADDLTALGVVRSEHG